MISDSLLDPYIDPFSGLEALENAFSTSVKMQSLADVPLGCFLSGGIDSSLICAPLQAQSTRPVSTLALASRNLPFNEAPLCSLHRRSSWLRSY